MKNWGTTAARLLSFAVIITAFIIGIAGSALGDDDRDHDKGLEQRVTKLEAYVANLENAIASMQQTIAQLQNGGPVAVFVNCNLGQSINTALAGNPGRPLVINFSGSCKEVVQISRDDVQLNGSAPSDSVTGVRMDNNQKAFLRNLTIANDFSAMGASTFNLDKVTVNGQGASNVVAVADSSSGAISNSTIQGGDFGVSVRQRSFLSLFSTTVTNSRIHGVVVEDASVEVDASTITANGSVGVYAMTNSSVTISGSQITNNAAGGVLLAGNSVASLNGAVINGNLSNGGIVAMASVVELGGVTITNNRAPGIWVAGGSVLTFVNQGPIVIQGNQGDGVAASDTSLIQSSNPANTVTITGNSGWGINCSPATSQVAQIVPWGPRLSSASVYGNSIGQSNCLNFQQ